MAPFLIFTLRPLAEHSSGFSTETTCVKPLGALGIVTVLALVVLGMATSTALTNLFIFLSSVVENSKPSSCSVTELRIALEVSATGT